MAISKGTYLIDKELELAILKNKLRILMKGRTDKGGGDKFIPGHMEYL